MPPFLPGAVWLVGAGLRVLAMAGQMLRIDMKLARAEPIDARLLAAGRVPNTPCTVVSPPACPKDRC